MVKKMQYYLELKRVNEKLPSKGFNEERLHQLVDYLIEGKEIDIYYLRIIMDRRLKTINEDVGFGTWYIYGEYDKIIKEQIKYN